MCKYTFINILNSLSDKGIGLVLKGRWCISCSFSIASVSKHYYNFSSFALMRISKIEKKWCTICVVIKLELARGAQHMLIVAITISEQFCTEMNFFGRTLYNGNSKSVSIATTQSSITYTNNLLIHTYLNFLKCSRDKSIGNVPKRTAVLSLN